MSQKDPSAKDPSAKSPSAPGAPILHRYDPKQGIAIPRPGAVAAPVNPSAGPIAGQTEASSEPAKPATTVRPVEIGGPSGPEPTRYGDWERNGRVSDF